MVAKLRNWFLISFAISFPSSFALHYISAQHPILLKTVNDSLDLINVSPDHPTASWFCCMSRTCLQLRTESALTLDYYLLSSYIFTVRNELEAVLEVKNFRDRINQFHWVSLPLLISLVNNTFFLLSVLWRMKVEKLKRNSFNLEHCEM